MPRYINFQTDNHTLVIGTTRWGKTYAVKESLGKSSRASFFFNTQLEKMPKNFIEASGKNSFQQIKAGLKKGLKINFLPSRDPEKRDAQLNAILDGFLNTDEKYNFVLVVDEVHLFRFGLVRRKLEQVATAGLRFGICGCWISQRPALIDKTLMSQSTKIVTTGLANERIEYFRNYGIPMEEMQRIINGRKYYYCEYEAGVIKGAFKV